jgi:hypothetical protein
VYYSCDDDRVPRPPNPEGPTPVRSVRIPESVWRPALERARAEGRSISSVINELMRVYLVIPPGYHELAEADRKDAALRLADELARLLAGDDRR